MIWLGDDQRLLYNRAPSPDTDGGGPSVVAIQRHKPGRYLKPFWNRSQRRCGETVTINDHRLPL